MEGIKIIERETTANVCTTWDTEVFNVKGGVRQEYALSITSFNIAFKYTAVEILIWNKQTNANWCYADDAAIISRSATEPLVEAYRKLIQESTAINLRVKVDNTKYIRLQKWQNTIQLGMEVNHQNVWEMDIIRNKLQPGVYYTNKPSFKDKNLTKAAWHIRCAKHK